MRIADATSFGHQNDTRSDGEGGYGEGTLLVLTNSSGEAIAYGWYGTESDAVLVTEILFGRPASWLHAEEQAVAEVALELGARRSSAPPRRCRRRRA